MNAYRDRTSPMVANYQRSEIDTNRTHPDTSREVRAFWQAVVATPITDEFLEWPADLFALTDVILARSEVYRFVLSPPHGVKWPPARFLNWSDAVGEASRQWSVW